MTVKPENLALVTDCGSSRTGMPSLKGESPVDTADRKLYQAEMLSKTLYGGGDEGFSGLNEVIKDGVLWLLSDLITEAREAREEANKRKETSR